MSKGKKYFLAYDCNLNVTNMKRHCPTAELVGTARIEDHELVFRGKGEGVLTIEPKKGAYVPVSVWRLTASDEERLYWWVYAGWNRTQIHLPVNFLNGKKKANVSAFVHTLKKGSPISPPSGYYLRICMEGYRDFGFDIGLIKEAYENSKKA